VITRVGIDLGASNTH